MRRITIAMGRGERRRARYIRWENANVGRGRKEDWAGVSTPSSSRQGKKKRSRKRVKRVKSDFKARQKTEEARSGKIINTCAKTKDGGQCVRTERARFRLPFAGRPPFLPI